MHLGELVEYGPSEQVFDRPAPAAHPRLHQRGLRVRLRAPALVLAALALDGMRDQRRKEREARKGREAQGPRRCPAQRRSGLSITRAEHGREGDSSDRSCTAPKATAAVVTLRNTSATRAARRADRDHRQGRAGATVYQNNDARPGSGARLGPAARRARRAHLGRRSDAGRAATRRASARDVGEGDHVGGAIPQLVGRAARSCSEGHGRARGSVVNHSARRTARTGRLRASRAAAATIVAAGRAVRPRSRRAGASTPFQVFFIGDTAAARSCRSAPRQHRLTRRPGSAPAPAALLERDPLEHVRDGLARVDRRLERLEDVLPADHDHRVDAAGEQRRDAVALQPVALVLETVDLDEVRRELGARCAGSAAPARSARRRRRAPR